MRAEKQADIPLTEIIKIKQSEKRNKPRGGPGKAFRAGMSLIELFDMLPNEDSARA